MVTRWSGLVARRFNCVLVWLLVTLKENSESPRESGAVSLDLISSSYICFCLIVIVRLVGVDLQETRIQSDFANRKVPKWMLVLE